MTRWVCFDEPGADAVRNTGPEPSLRHGDALVAAVRAPGNGVIIIPSADTREVAVLSVVKRERVPAPVIEVAKPARIGQASGFLGLSDEPEFADEPEQKPWWRRR